MLMYILDLSTGCLMVISAEPVYSFPNRNKKMKPFTHFRLPFLFMALFSLGVPEAFSFKITDDFSEDYENVYGPTKRPTVRPGPPRSLEKCYKNLCEDLPAPCDKLAKESGCLCPGSSIGPGALPDPPTVKVLWQAGGAPEVRWCAAYAYNTVYKVLVGGQEVGEFNELKRMTVFENLSAGAEVCVQASNEVGTSALGKHSCEVYNPPKDSASLALKVGLIGGALGLLLLILIAVLLWRQRSPRKDRANVSNEEVH